jgi:Spy/CpxP family protein refolding chaperone
MSTEKRERVSKMAGALAAGLALLAASAVSRSSEAAGRELSSERMVTHMARRLDLTDAQTQQIRRIFDARQAEMKTQFQALRAARQALRQATLATPVNEGAIRNAAQALAQAEGDAAVLRAQVHAQILPLLNSEQQRKFAASGDGAGGRWHAHGAPPSE